MRMLIWTSPILWLCLFFTSCTAPPSPPQQPAPINLTPVAFSDLPGWEAENHTEAREAILTSCRTLLDKKPSGLVAKTAGLNRTDAFTKACRRLNAADAKTALEAAFTPYRVQDATPSPGLFTGYYLPSFPASLKKDAIYKIPVYGRPKDLSERQDTAGSSRWGRWVGGKWQDYPSRAAIDTGALSDKAEVLVWAKDPVDVFFLQVQGSGFAVLPDGRRLHLRFAGRNGHPYTAIGKVLIEKGALKPDQVSMASIRAWLASVPPRQRDAVLHQNASYIFFQKDRLKAPKGAAGVALVPQRSLAIDPKFWSYGMPVWVDIPGDAKLPGGIERMMITHDTGAAIRGVVRGDVFWGEGALAEARAGAMRHEGAIYVLVPRE